MNFALAMSVVFFFLADPVRVLCECRGCCGPARSSPSTRPVRSCGTAAALELLASVGQFYSGAVLAALASQPGLQEARVRNDGGGQVLTARS